MGWTVVEPLSPGVFQIDPSVYGAEPNRVFNVGAGAVGKNVQKNIIKRLWAQMSEIIIRNASKLISLRVGKKVTVEVSEEVGESFVKKATKQLDDEVIKSGKNKGSKWKKLKDSANPQEKGAYTKALNGKVQKLTDDAAEGLIDPDDLGKAIKLDDVAKANKLADDAAAKGGKEIGEEVVEEGGEKTAKELTQEASEKTKTTLDDAGTGNNKGLSEAQKGIYRMANRTGLSVIALWGAYSLLLPVASAAGDAVGDTGEGVLKIFTGENCREKIEANYPSNPEVWSEKTEECESQAAFRTMLMGGAAVSLVGVLGLVLITRLLPSKTTEDEEQEE